MRCILLTFLATPACVTSTHYLSSCDEDLVVEISTVTLGDDGIHEQGEQCFVVDQATGSIDYTACCPMGWDYLALGGEGILCQWAGEIAPAECYPVVEVALYSSPDGVTQLNVACPIINEDNSTDYTACCPTEYFPTALGPDLSTVICQISS